MRYLDATHLLHSLSNSNYSKPDIDTHSFSRFDQDTYQPSSPRSPVYYLVFEQSEAV